MSETETWIQHKTELAAALHVNRKTLQRALDKPGAPTFVEGKGWPFEAVKKWMLNTVRGTMVVARIDDDIGDLKKWEIYERARRMQVRNDRDAGLLLAKVDVERQWAHCISENQRILGAIPQRLAPAIVGLTVPEAEKMLKHALDEAVKELAT